MKYYARIDGRQTGPMTLGQLVEAGVTPSTWVWTKGMADWQKAEDVPDICRAMRRMLAGLDPLTGGARTAPSGMEGIKEMPQEGVADSQVRFGFIPEPKQIEDFSLPPQGVSVLGALVVTLLCFAPTGIAAVWFAMSTRTYWRMGTNPGIPAETARAYRVKAHSSARVYRILMGISFSIGFIMLGLISSRLLQ